MADENPIYLDHHSTTPCDPRVVERMLPYFSESFGNPAAVTHAHGRRAATALEEARSVTAGFFRVRPNEVYFTAGATESNNIALRGSAARGGHLIVSAIEHKSVLAPAKLLESDGVGLTILAVDGEGFVSPGELAASIRPDTALVSIMAANGEIGTIEPIRELASICRERGIRFHTDATQAVGKVPIDLSEIDADLVSISAHKFYGPKGIGALIVRRGASVRPLIIGGGQEKNLRSGTVNVAGAIGLAEALSLREREMSGEAARLEALRDRLWDTLVAELPGIFVHGPRESRLPGNLNLTFSGLDAEAIMFAMRRFSLSSGSACSSAERDASSVLRAIGVNDEDAFGSIRFGLGSSNSDEEIDLLITDLKTTIPRLREMSVASL